MIKNSPDYICVTRFMFYTTMYSERYRHVTEKIKIIKRKQYGMDTGINTSVGRNTVADV